MASLGQELKNAREDRGITLREIADTTNIGMIFLQAIENDNFDLLPGGIFTRAFIKKFANFVGYDEAQAIGLYEAQIGETGGEPQRRFYTGFDEIEHERGTGNGILLSLLALIILAAGAYLAYEYFKASPEVPHMVPGQGSMDSTSNRSDDTTTTLPPEPVSSSTSGIVSAAEPEHDPDELRIQLISNGGDCWVSIKTDAEKSQQLTLIQGDTREFVATDRMVLNIGNFPALTIRINGRVVNGDKLAPNRKSVVAENIIITKENYLQFVD